LLETACGTGVLTRALAKTLPETVAITATDLNTDARSPNCSRAVNRIQ
jgi:ubiquinone/menaquinone biosynthesis C-methylase UbiE